jgi:CheY-like chemotaxis protein/signal transduction histidine kinase
MNEAEFPEYRKKLVNSLTFMKTTLNSLVGTYQILLMTINRFTDYTKISHEIPLVPTMESVHLIDTLIAPISCVQDLQNRIHIDVEPMDKNISEFIMTDRQWLQDNILCLVSNAVKFSMRGTTVVRALLTSASVSSSSSGLILPCDTKSVECAGDEEKDIFHDLERGIFRTGSDDHLSTQMIRFEVEDQGVGIIKSMETRQKLNLDELSSDLLTAAVFSEPNIAGKKAAGNVGGSGLGLFCLSKRVEALGGFYGVEEKKSNALTTATSSGTLFWFTIPYSPDYGKLKPAPSIRSSIQSSGKAKVHDPFTYRWFGNPTAKLCDISPLSSLDHLKESLSRKSSFNSKSLSPPSRKVQFRETRFTLPQQKLSTPDSYEHDAKISGKEHILVVDDSLAIVKMLKIMLEKKGFLVSTASNGLEAVEMINSYVSGKGDSVNNLPPIDAVLMDIQMPIMDGIEAINKVRQLEKEAMKEPENSAVSSSEHFNHLIVAMSASSDDETVNSAYTAGADEFIAKPFNVVSFQKILSEYADRKRAPIDKSSDCPASAVPIQQKAPSSLLSGEYLG